MTYSLPRVGLALTLGATVALTACAKSPDLLDAIPTAGATSVATSATPETLPSQTTTASPSETTSEPMESTGAPEPSAGEQPTSPTPSASATETTPSASATPTPSATPKPPALLKQGDSGEKVRDLHARLRQLDWYSGKIRPDYDAETAEAVAGFQTKRGLPPTGEVDQATLDKLVGMTRTPTHDELHNILRPGPALYKAGAKGDEVRRLQVRLKELAWYDGAIDGEYGPKTVASVKGFQGKREIPVTGEVDRRTLDLLVSMTATPTAEQMYNKPPKPKARGALDPRCMTGRAICINKDTRQLAWVVDGKVQLTVDVRFGSVATPTREGAFSVYWKSRDHVSKLYQSKMPYALFFSGGQAVHYSSDFAARGYAGASHGCVNVRDKKAVAWLFDQTRVGDKVIVYRA